MTTPLPDWLVGEIARREAAQASLAEYADRVVLDEDVSPAAHHRVICEAIDRLLADDYDDLIVNTPPGSAKSTYTSHALSAYYMGRWPTRSIILATHTADLSEKWSRKVRNTLADPRHAEVFDDSALSKDSTAVSRWATSRGGEFLAAGVGASILGFRADLAVIDDPVAGFEQAQSLTQLAKIHSWFETDLITRLKPRGKIVLICQRLSPNDLAGYLIERHRQNPTRRIRVLKLRMEAVEGEDDGTGRAPGDRLWPEWFTPEMVEDARRDDFKWRTLYQQEPPSEDGAWVSTENIRFRPTPPTALAPETPRYGATDLALSVNSGDYTCHFVIAIDPRGDWDIVHGERARVDTDQSAARIVSLTSAFAPREWLIDDDNASKVFVKDVAYRSRAAGVPVPWKPMPMRGQDKETRAAPLRGQFKRGCVYMPADAPFTKWLVEELLRFPNATGSGVDDGVDTLSLFGRRLTELARPVSNVIPLRQPTTNEMTLDGLWDTVPRQSRRI